MEGGAGGDKDTSPTLRESGIYMCKRKEDTSIYETILEKHST